MRTEFNYFLVVPNGISHVNQPLPVFPSRIKPEEPLKITVKEAKKQKDWTKIGLIVVSFGLVSAVAVLGYILYQRGFLTSTPKQELVSNGNLNSLPVQTKVIQPLVQAAPVTIASAPATTTNVTHPVEAASTVSPNTGSQSVASTASTPMSPAPVTQVVTQEAASVKENVPPAVKKSIVAQPAPKAVNKTVEKTSPAPALSVAPAAHPAEVPKFIIASENNVQATKPAQAGIFKRPMQQPEQKPVTSTSAKPVETQQKLF